MQAIPHIAKLLGHSGALPFAVLAISHAFGGQQFEALALRSFIFYGAVILSFLGGIRWGVASMGVRFGALASSISILPSLWAFACLLWPDPEFAVWGLMAGFLVLAIADRWFPPPGGAAWMIVLRARLSSVVLACHGVMISSIAL